MIKRKPTHPGLLLLEEVINPLGISISEAAIKLGVSRKALSELVHERVNLSPEMAVRLAKATGTSAKSWLEMQNKLDIWRIEQKNLTISPFMKADTHYKTTEDHTTTKN